MGERRILGIRMPDILPPEGYSVWRALRRTAPEDTSQEHGTNQPEKPQKPSMQDKILEALDSFGSQGIEEATPNQIAQKIIMIHAPQHGWNVIHGSVYRALSQLEESGQIRRSLAPYSLSEIAQGAPRVKLVYRRVEEPKPPTPQG